MALLLLELLLFQLELVHKSLSVVVKITDYMTPQNVTDVTTSSLDCDWLRLAKYDWRRRHCDDDSGRLVRPPLSLDIWRLLIMCRPSLRALN